MLTPRITLLIASAVLVGSIGGMAANAATITHTTLQDFSSGLPDTVVQPLLDPPVWSGAPVATDGGVGVVPTPGASILSEDFSYSDVASAQAAGWLFLTPNAGNVADLVANPSSFNFSGNPGSLRMHVSRPQEFWDTSVAGTFDLPVLAAWNTPLTGDWVAETKVTFQQIEPDRGGGIFVMLPGPADVTNGKITNLTVDATTAYTATGLFNPDGLRAWARMYPSDPNNYASLFQTIDFGFGQPGTTYTWWIRLVKHGPFFASYFKPSENGTWVFQNWFKVPLLAAAPNAPVAVGVYAHSWGGTSEPDRPRYQDVDFDYFHVSQIGMDAGSYTNVFDAGGPVDWRTLSLTTRSIQGLGYQLRAGNTLSNGTLTDAGDFAGPNGPGTSYKDDAAQVIPNAHGKRYLEYKLDFQSLVPTFPGQTVDNLAPILDSISASYEPGALSSLIASNASEFGADSQTVSSQTGGGDLGIARTQAFFDDFNGPLNAAWTLDPGNYQLDPTIAGSASTTDRAGFLRMTVGYPQDFYAGPNKLGGVRLFHDVPNSLADFEVETEVTMDDLQARQFGLILWQDANNYVLFAGARRGPDFYDIGVLNEQALNNVDAPGVFTRSYGSNRLQLRITKQGQIITESFKSPDSPSWRTHLVLNTAGMATGGGNFAPTQFALFGKSYGFADRGAVFADFDYAKVSSLAPNGTKDVVLNLPNGAMADTLLLTGENLSNASARFQLKSGGNYVGPDGTGSTYFNQFETRVPDALQGQPAQTVKVALDGTTPVGAPYLHTLGAQYLTGQDRVARDGNRPDFVAAKVKTNVDVDSVPGLVTTTVIEGTPIRDDFNYTSNDLTATPWAWSNTPNNQSAYSFTDNPGFLRIKMGRPEDLWERFAPVDKPRIFFYRKETVPDFEIETHLTLPQGREADRVYGLGIVQQLPGGAPPDQNLDLGNCVIFGQATFYPNGGGVTTFTNSHVQEYFDAPNSWPDDVYLRIRKVGANLSFYWRANPTDPWILDRTLSHPNLTNPYVGFLGRAWPTAVVPQQWPVDYDYFTLTPINATGIVESRVLDLGSSGLYPVMHTQGANMADVQIQWRGANTTDALATAPYIGPDGTSKTSYSGTYSGPIPSLLGYRYYQYKATLPGDGVLDDVAILGLTSASVPFSQADVLSALRIAAGLSQAQSAQLTRYDIVGGASAGRVDMLDVVAIGQALR